MRSNQLLRLKKIAIFLKARLLREVEPPESSFMIVLALFLKGSAGLGENFDFTGDHSDFDEAKLASGADGDVDDASFYKRTTVSDRDDFAAAITEVGDANFGSKAESAVGRGCSGVAEAFAGSRRCSAIRFDRIP